MKEKLEGALEVDGYGEPSTIFPNILSEDDINTLINDHLGVQGLILEDNMMILSSFLDKCVTKLKPKIIQLAESSENEIEVKTDKKKKGGKSSSLPMNQTDISRYLEEQKVLEYIVDEDQRSTFFKHLLPLLNSEYESIKAELVKRKQLASSDIVSDLNGKIEHLGMGLLMANATIKQILDQNPEFDTSIAESMHIDLSGSIVERILLLNLKRFKIHIDPSLMANKASDDRMNYII